MKKLRRLRLRLFKKSDSEDATNKWKDRIVPVGAVVLIIGIVVAFAKVPALQLDKQPRQLPAAKIKATTSPVLPTGADGKKVWLDKPRRTDIVTRQ